MSKISFPGNEGTEKKLKSVVYAELNLPPDTLILSEAFKAIADSKTSQDELALLLSQDSVLAFDILKAANTIGDKRESITIASALIRLGSTKTFETLTASAERPLLLTRDVVRCFDIHRSRGKRIALISRMIATSVARSLSDECQVAGLFFALGDMITTVHLGDIYPRLFDEAQSRPALLYRLLQEYKLDIEKLGTTYLNRNAIPEILAAPYSREKVGKSKEFIIIRSIVLSAAELVEHFDSNRWDKLAPGKILPSTSSLKLLNFTDEGVYKKLYERASEYLFSVRTSDLARQRLLLNTSGSTSLEVIKALSDRSAEKSKDTFSPPAPLSPFVKEITEESTQTHAEILQEKFDLSRTSQKKGRVISTETPSPKKHEIKVTATQQKVATIIDSIDDYVSSEQLINALLSALVDKGPFKKTALIVVSRDRKDAIVVASRGPIQKSGVRFSLDDPLSPLALCLSKVQSFGAYENKSTPFGSKTYALAPIEADHDTPVALYADCGNDGSITFEARRIFRTIVEIANEKLKTLPGGIPIEFEV